MSFVEPAFALFLLLVAVVFLALPSLRLQLSWLLALIAVVVLTLCVWVSYRYQAHQAFIYFQF